MPACVKCGASVFARPLYRSTAIGSLPPGKWVCEPCGGRPRDEVVRRIVDALTTAPGKEESDHE